jgi:hypothetical protein
MGLSIGLSIQKLRSLDNLIVSLLCANFIICVLTSLLCVLVGTLVEQARVSRPSILLCFE